MYLRRQFLSALHVIERQHVGIGAGRGLLKAAAGHAQDGIHAFDDLAQGPGVQADEDLAGVADGSGREGHVMPHRAFEAAVEHEVALAPVGDHFDLAHHDVGAVGAARHTGRERQLELTDALGLHGKLRPADAAGFHGEIFGGHVVHQGEPVVLL